MTGQRAIAVLVTVLVIFLSTAKSVFAMGFHPGLRLNSFSIKTPTAYEKSSSDLWITTQSNNRFKYQITNNFNNEKMLKLKSLRSGNRYTLYKSSLVKEFSQLDVSPDGKSIVFAVKINQDDGFINEVHILNFNKETGFILSDGIVHNNNDDDQLTGINFDQTNIILEFKDNHGNKTQNERSWVLQEFSTGKVPIMVATDVAARGLGKHILFIV